MRDTAGSGEAPFAPGDTEVVVGGGGGAGTVRFGPAAKAARG